MRSIKNVQRAAWAVRDLNARREAAKYLLPELNVDPFDLDAKDDWDGQRFGQNKLWDDLRGMFGEGYESYEGNPKSMHEKKRQIKLKQTMLDMERKEKLYQELKKDEEE